MKSSVNKRTLDPEFFRYKSLLSPRLSVTSVFVPIKVEWTKIQKRFYPGQDKIKNIVNTLHNKVPKIKPTNASNANNRNAIQTSIQENTTNNNNKSFKEESLEKEKQNTSYEFYKKSPSIKETVESTGALNQLPPIDSAKLFKEATQNGIVQYIKQGDARLSEYGWQLYQRTSSSRNSMYANKTNSSVEENSDKEYLVGVINNISDDTEILLPSQTHPVIGVRDFQNSNDVKVVGICTSNKGTKSGIANASTSIKISETQISGENKAQYAYTIAPPLLVNENDFTPHENSETFLNNKNVLAKIKEIEVISSEYEAVAYKPAGVTLGDLHDLVDLHNTLSCKQAKGNTEHETKTENNDDAYQPD